MAGTFKRPVSPLLHLFVLLGKEIHGARSHRIGQLGGFCLSHGMT